ncbi:MAG TPA: DUF1588 domain-containing protein, partial [Polyangiales bacterium]|nr:DUF1588 domain-containing protein [Polyangiales bacterium]
KTEFLHSAIRRAFRRPPAPEDLEAYAALYELGRENDSDGTGPFRAVIRALLTSPYFLYRTELGRDPAQPSFELTQHELASLLSFSLLDGPPPAALLEAADAGQLADSRAIARQLDLLLELPEASAAFQKFLLQWLKLHHFEDLLDKDPVMFPTYRAVRPDMVREAEQFVSAHGNLADDLGTLLTSPVVPSGALSEFYGSEPSAAGEVGVRTGLLGLGAVLAARSKANVTSPTLRGLFIRERLLCQHIQLPPDSVPDIVKTIVARQPRTTRETYQFHAEQPVCAGCHVQLDPLGFNFEDFDAAGRFRKLENGVPIDTHGELINSDVNAPTQQHTELALRLAASEWVRNCFVQQTYRYYFGRVEAERDVAALQAARAAFAGGGSFRALLVGLWSSPNTRQRVRQP